MAKNVKVLLTQLREVPTQNSNFYEIGLLDVLAYFYLRREKVGKASQLFDKLQKQVELLESCDLTATVYRTLGIWHTRRAYYGLTNNAMQDKDFETALYFFEKNRADLLAFEEQCGHSKSHDIIVANIWMIRCKLKIPWLTLQPTNNAHHAPFQKYNFALFTNFMTESRIKQQSLNEAHTLIDLTRQKIEMLEKVAPIPCDRYSDIQALEVAYYFRCGQTHRENLCFKQALKHTEEYQLEQSDKGFGWISALVHVIKLHSCQPYRQSNTTLKKSIDTAPRDINSDVMDVTSCLSITEGDQPYRKLKQSDSSQNMSAHSASGDISSDIADMTSSLSLSERSQSYDRLEHSDTSKIMSVYSVSKDIDSDVIT